MGTLTERWLVLGHPMPKKRRTGRAAKEQSAREQFGGEPADFSHLVGGGRRTEFKLGSEWVVQSISASRAQKEYVCPGCPHPVPPATAHVVVWRNDHFFGDEHAVTERRHWHEHCWRLAR